MRITGFRELGIGHEVLRAIEELGFGEPFPVQLQAIPPLLEGRDVIGQAKTGTGKTAAFGIPMVEAIDGRCFDLQGLVIVPTRELAIQVASDLRSFGKYLQLRSMAVYGGHSIHAEMQRIADGVQIVVGTPGRLIDHIQRGSLKLGHLRFLVLDEADRLLEMGFIEDVEFIIRNLPEQRQTALFSATMPEQICHLAHRYMKAPEEILVDSDDQDVASIDHFYRPVEREEKLRALCDLLQRQEGLCIVFCATKRGTGWLERALRREGFSVTGIHGDMSQHGREESLRAFREGKREILVATDVAGRGLDIEGVTHVINFDTPRNPLTYLHRIGRTGRAGRRGVAVTLVTSGERMDFIRIRQVVRNRMMEIPGAIASTTSEGLPRRGHNSPFHEDSRSYLRP